MSDAVPIEQWPQRLESVLETCAGFRRVHVVRDTNSTQDAARRLGAVQGDVVVAWNQTTGRGRLGRSWSSGTLGAAVTFVLAPGPGQRLALVGAVAAARAAEDLLQRAVGIKWPNDIFVKGQKLAGVLVEQNDRVAWPGIGMNVGQTRWPAELADSAVSLLELGVDVDRVEVLGALIAHMDRAHRDDDDTLIEFFRRHDAMSGGRWRFLSEGREIEGWVRQVEPLEGIRVETSEGEMWLPAPSTTVLEGLEAP